MAEVSPRLTLGANSLKQTGMVRECSQREKATQRGSQSFEDPSMLIR